VRLDEQTFNFDENGRGTVVARFGIDRLYDRRGSQTFVYILVFVKGYLLFPNNCWSNWWNPMPKQVKAFVNSRCMATRAIVWRNTSLLSPVAHVCINVQWLSRVDFGSAVVKVYMQAIV